MLLLALLLLWATAPQTLLVLPLALLLAHVLHRLAAAATCPPREHQHHLVLVLGLPLLLQVLLHHQLAECQLPMLLLLLQLVLLLPWLLCLAAQAAPWPLQLL